MSKEPLTLEQAIDKAERYCVRAERSERDILRKCYDWQVPPITSK